MTRPPGVDLAAPAGHAVKRPIVHLVLVGATVALVALCLFRPFLPGDHDPVAMPLAVLTQVLGVAALLLVPAGIVWLVAGKGYRFVLGSLAVASLPAVAFGVMLGLGLGASVGIAALVLWGCFVLRLVPRLGVLQNAADGRSRVVPLYLVVVPVATVLLQVLLAAPAAEFSRNRAIAASAELIDEIERHRATHGSYPSNLAAVWLDYSPSVVGIDRFHYAASGTGYSLYFEQPRLLFDNFGTREFVMYNERDEHVMPSHVAWILLWSAEELSRQQGWYAVHDAGSPHWKYFWFD